MNQKSNYILLLVFVVFACSTPAKKESKNIEKVKILGKVIPYTSDSTEMIGYISFNENDSSKRPGILVVHEWWGHNEYSRMRADMLAELGYVALAVDMYGDGKQASHPDDAGQFASMVMGNFDEAKTRFESALETLKNHPNVNEEKIGAIGYCFGGSVVLSMANAGYDLDAVVSFHGGLKLPVLPNKESVKGKILVANGADDTFISKQQISDFKTVMDSVGVDYKFINYEGSLHSFTSKAADSLAIKFEMPIAYNAMADSASWEEMKKLFKESF